MLHTEKNVAVMQAQQGLKVLKPFLRNAWMAEKFITDFSFMFGKKQDDVHVSCEDD